MSLHALCLHIASPLPVGTFIPGIPLGLVPRLAGYDLHMCRVLATPPREHAHPWPCIGEGIGQQCRPTPTCRTKGECKGNKARTLLFRQGKDNGNKGLGGYAHHLGTFCALHRHIIAL